MKRDDDDREDRAAPLTRRLALARLGLGAAAVYSAPVILHLDRSANATVAVTPCARGRGRKAPWCNRRDRDDRQGRDDRHERDDRNDRNDRHGGGDRGRDRDRGKSGGGGNSNGRGRG